MAKRKRFAREIEGMIRSGLKKFPVVLLEGSRQVGKTNTVEEICAELGGAYITLDDMDSWLKAKLKPKDLLQGAKSGFVVVDEIQREPLLFITAKRYVDMYRRPGMFLLTGSSKRYKSKKNYESMSGRQQTLLMRPLSQAEIESARTGVGPAFVNVMDAIRDGLSPPDASCAGLKRRIWLGGYPIVVNSPRDKDKKIEEFILIEIINEFLMMGGGKSIAMLPRFLRKMTRKQGKVINIREIANECGLSGQEGKAVADMLDDSYVFEPLPSLGYPLGGKQLVRKAKVYLNDTGLSTNLLELDAKSVDSSPYWGTLLESFVLAELRKHLTTSSFSRLALPCHYKETEGIEVDIVFYDSKRDTYIAIEVKASNRVDPSDWRNLETFRLMAHGKCERAILLYTGSKVERLSEGVEAWPVSCLWKWREKK